MKIDVPALLKDLMRWIIRSSHVADAAIRRTSLNFFVRMLVRLGDDVPGGTFQYRLLTDVPDHLSLIEKVESGVKLLRAYDPYRYKKLTRLIPTVFISDFVFTDGDPAYHPGVPCIALLTDFVQDAPTHVLATILVHESTHAQIHRAGISTIPKVNKYRIEKICREQEIAFLRKTPFTEFMNVRLTQFSSQN